MTLKQIEDFERLYARHILPFYKNAKAILAELLQSEEYRSVRDALREANQRLPSERRMTLERAEEMLDRCVFRCECDFINCCRKVIANLLTLDRPSGPARVLENIMEGMFIERLGCPDLGNFIFENFSELGPAAEKIFLECDIKASSVQELPPGTLQALCGCLPASYPRWGRAGYVSTVVMPQNRHDGPDDDLTSNFHLDDNYL